MAEPHVPRQPPTGRSGGSDVSGFEVPSEEQQARFASNVKIVRDAERLQAESRPVNKRAEVLRKAEELINGDRAQAYGSPEDSFGRIADCLNAIGIRVESGRANEDRSFRKVGPVDVALILVQLKVSRTVGNPEGEDNWVDMAGYAGLGAELAIPVWDGKNDGVGYNIEAERPQSDLVIVYEFVALPSSTSEVAAIYFWRCRECLTYMDEVSFASHAWLSHDTRSFRIEKSVISEIPVEEKPEAVSVHFEPVAYPRKRKGVKNDFKCNDCSELVEGKDIESHLKKRHPDATIYYVNTMD